jgi:hypothetical protein
MISNRDDQSVPDILQLDACVIADTLNMLYLMESQQFKTGKVIFLKTIILVSPTEVTTYVVRMPFQ